MTFSTFAYLATHACVISYDIMTPRILLARRASCAAVSEDPRPEHGSSLA